MAANRIARRRWRIFNRFPDKADLHYWQEMREIFPDSKSKCYQEEKEQIGRFKGRHVGGMNHAPAHFRRCLNRLYRARMKRALIQGKEMPLFRKNAAWL
jgi:hypothetical protein